MVITIDAERCDGCGSCVEACPTGAVYLVEGKATLDEALCRECEACLAACPAGAIALTEQGEPGAEAARLPALRSEPEVIRVKAQPALVPARSRILSAVGAALAWAGREIMPPLVGLLDRQATRLQAGGAARSRQIPASGAKGGGRQHRQRRRGGSE